MEKFSEIHFDIDNITNLDINDIDELEFWKGQITRVKCLLKKKIKLKLKFIFLSYKNLFLKY